jgi:hypothetical protein
MHYYLSCGTEVEEISEVVKQGAVHQKTKMRKMWEIEDEENVKIEDEKNVGNADWIEKNSDRPIVAEDLSPFGPR